MFSKRLVLQRFTSVADALFVDVIVVQVWDEAFIPETRDRKTTGKVIRCIGALQVVHVMQGYMIELW